MRDVLTEWRPVVDDAIETLLPRDIDEAYLVEWFGPASHRYDPDAIQRALSDPIWDLLDRGGKRWRAVVCLLLLDGFGADPRAYLPYACIPEVLHNGTIIVDDVEDGAEIRRGEPALHHRFGPDIALNAGNAMYFLPLKVIGKNPADLDPETQLATYEMLMDELNRTHLGQGMDIYWHRNRDATVAEAEYLEMCACKTGCLGRIVARLAAIITDQPPEVEREVAAYAEDMSIAFQIGDDILDVESTIEGTTEFGKAFGNDIREGKRTLMVIHALSAADPVAADRLSSILHKPENTREEITEAIGILQSTDSIEYARECALSFSQSAREHLRDVPLDEERADQLASFTEFVIERDV
ncbi:polyprenyl synthetase family protein [Halalkalicoccus jeotgali]|uniref:Polyprenyl synthetase n=1 Tax=Halalkalicoccus jeotgali (strain DSM 18796 / CECT 7217 / JCM 14584 / KCTC 4019 / B3) TaxID=795797 RepID=D8J643_HALJB|nr:polyprenyl synthetase family protein [Halalkalicoccus jeotgali]ADJ15761.1 Polyprenyl synthetase [Halalkalicoccus jeotgali B3]ELY37215.1 Polyprenyl synthetase [Halalkalicoccus jeotgali B3]